MYRVRLNYDVPQWAYHRRCAAIAKHAPDDFQVETGAWHPCVTRDIWPESQRYDLILQVVPDHANLRKLLDDRGHRATVIVGGLNVGYGHHAERLRMCRTGADHIVVNNLDCYERLRRPNDMTWISNGVDLSTYRITKPIAERIEPRILWTGCDFHSQPEGSRKGTAIKGYEEILKPLRKRLHLAGIPLDLRRVNSSRPSSCHSTEEMVRWYNTGQVYLCASSSEGTPNPALEAAACGCTVVSTPVGNMLELIDDRNGLLVDRTVDTIESAVLHALDYYQPMATAMQESIQEWGWKEQAAQYYDLFRRLINERREVGPPVSHDQWTARRQARKVLRRVLEFTRLQADQALAMCDDSAVARMNGSAGMEPGERAKMIRELITEKEK